MSCDPLAGLRVVYQLDPALSDDEAIAAMEVIRNAPPPDPEPDVNERLAAAMEFQNILTMAAMTEGGGTE